MRAWRLRMVVGYREGIEVVSSSDHYEGGTTDFYNLSIRNSTRYDQGVYTVVLENEVGASEPNDAIYVSIYFKPTVSLTMETSTLTPTPVRELDRMNITLVCRVEQGNPDLLIGVRWYLGGELLKELPDCEGGNATSPTSAASDLTFCDIDPSRLLLENVGRGFHGNYSCEGRNEAGWGPLSQDQELVVYYPPGPSTLVYEPREVVKKGTVTLRCTVEEPGYPETSTFKWMRGTHHIPNVTSASLTNPVTLETESNFTCLAYNEGGEGEPATIYIDVLAPPAFIGRLPLYHGALVTAQNVSVSCRVECSPLCAVHWLKNGQHLGDTSRAGSQYRVNNTILPPDTRSGDFESTLSTLVWNMAAWPGGRLDRIHDNDNYTCQSDDNIAGPGVRSSTIFRVEYPPENITVSNKRVNVTETDVPEWVICNAKAYPEAMYQWYKDGERNTTVLKGGNTLILSGPLKKERGGNYTCEAFNRHGNITQKTFINVLYKPQCGITQSDQDGKLVLVCTADANPTDVDFTWRIKNENDTIEENIEKRGLQSFLTLDTYVETFRTYLCFANNSVGMSIPCERDVTAGVASCKIKYSNRLALICLSRGLTVFGQSVGHVDKYESDSMSVSGHLGWWRMENENMIIVVAVVIGGIIMVLIICVIIIIVCRRKRADDKYNNPVEMEERENTAVVFSPEGDPGHPPDQPPVRPVHKWPLRPGVLVHVNGAHSLSLGRLPQTSGSLVTSTPKHRPNNNHHTTGRTRDRVGKKAKRRRAVSVGALATTDEINQHSRANRIRQMFTSDYRCDTLPGVIHSKSEVVTFKKLDGSSNRGVSRKRKKPGAGQ
uniref:Ig-like domain-containing protein n=1 Tax=Timema genevievae TaxID=629358 RepID=A0A7R9JXR8_TIMGE|nr:unnamed protein product [Timema genevievae]